MITFKKGNDIKFIDKDSTLIAKLKAAGWTEATEEKEVKNGKSSKSSN